MEQKTIEHVDNCSAVSCVGSVGGFSKLRDGILAHSPTSVDVFPRFEIKSLQVKGLMLLELVIQNILRR